MYDPSEGSLSDFSHQRGSLRDISRPFSSQWAGSPSETPRSMMRVSTPSPSSFSYAVSPPSIDGSDLLESQMQQAVSPEAQVEELLSKFLATSLGAKMQANARTFSREVPNIAKIEIERSAQADSLGFSAVAKFSEYCDDVDDANSHQQISAASLIREFRPNMILIVSVVSKKTFAISVRVEHACDRSDKVFRYVKDYSVLGTIETVDLSEKGSDAASQEIWRALRPGDYLKAVVKEVDLADGMLILTLRKSQVNVALHQRHHPLGLMDPQAAVSEMTTRQKRSLLEDLRMDSNFYNPNSIFSMAAAYGVNLSGNFLHDPPSGPFYDDLRKMQNRKWAQDIVAQGIQYAKKEDYKTAMKYYSQALYFDPDNKDAHVARGACFYNINMLEDAEKEFAEALRIDPDDANAAKYMDSTRQKLKQQKRENEDAHISSIPASMASSRHPIHAQAVPTPQVSLPTPPGSSSSIYPTQQFPFTENSSDQALHMLGVTTSTERLKELLKEEERKRRGKEKRDKGKEKRRRDKSKKRRREKDKDKDKDKDRHRSRSKEKRKSKEKKRDKRRSRDYDTKDSSSSSSTSYSDSRDSERSPKRARRRSPSNEPPH